MSSQNPESGGAAPRELDEARVRRLAEDVLEARVARSRVDVDAWKLENWIERARNELHRDSLRRLLGVLLLGLVIGGLGWEAYGEAARERFEAELVQRVLAHPDLARTDLARTEPPRGPEAAPLPAPPAPSPPELPLGTVLPYAGEPDVKALFEQGFMLCNGQRLVANTLGWTPEEFEALWSALGKAWGGGETRSGQRYLHLPDLRGLFLRGVDAGAGKDLEASRRSPEGQDLRVALYEGGNTGDRVGSYQSDTAGRPEGFTRPGKILFYACTEDPSEEVACPPLSLYAPRWFQDPEDEKWIEPVRGSEVDTRPKNAAVHWIVKVRSPRPSGD